MKRAGILIAALLLASCAFSADRPLLDGEHIATPLPEGAYEWRPYPPEEETLRVTFRRVGEGYELLPVDRPGERPIRVRMTDVIETHDDDYIAEIDLAEGRGSAYAFLWPFGDDRYRVVFEPRAFSERGETAAPDLCSPVTFGGCHFTSLENLRAYYLREIYPAMRDGGVPAHYIDIAPVDGDVPLPPVRPPTKPRPQ